MLLRITLLALSLCWLVYASSLLMMPQEAVGWCETEDRGDVVPEFKVDKTFVVVDWEGSGDDGLYGQASWMLDEELQLTTCTVEIPLPDKVWGDEDMDTVGHEFLHCLIGDFHE